jgi:hypothetical protein
VIGGNPSILLDDWSRTPLAMALAAFGCGACTIGLVLAGVACGSGRRGTSRGRLPALVAGTDADEGAVAGGAHGSPEIG